MDTPNLAGGASPVNIGDSPDPPSVAASLDRIAGAAERLVDAAAPLLTLAARWLERHVETPPKQRQPRPRQRDVVSELMFSTLQDQPESRAWSAERWADHANCSPATVARTEAWEQICRYREFAVRERRESYSGRQAPRASRDPLTISDASGPDET